MVFCGSHQRLALTSVYTPHLATHVAGSPGTAGAAHGRKKGRDRAIIKQWRSTRIQRATEGVRVVHREYIETLIQQQRN